MPLLEVSKLTKAFGGLIALNNFNLDVEEGQLVGLIAQWGGEDHGLQSVDRPL